MSNEESLLISTLEVEARLVEARDFPWDRVDADPKVTAEVRPGFIEFVNAGPAPALEFTCAATTPDGTVLYRRETEKLEKKILDLDLDQPVEGWRVHGWDGGSIRPPVFYLQRGAVDASVSSTNR